MRIRLNIAYDGAGFQGWQVQPGARTVQGELESVLERFHGGEKIRTHAAGRTDTGVHATGQVIHYDCVHARDETATVNGLNALLPGDVRIWRAMAVPDEFHARFSARGRRYAYRLLRRDDLFLRRYAWVVRPGFDLEAARNAAALFSGEHDFRAFATRPDPDENTVCRVTRAEWIEDDLGWLFEIEADRFVRRMVRGIAGASVAHAKHQVNLGTLHIALDNGTGRVPPPAPPEGLSLVRVRYDSDDLLDQPDASLWRPFLLRE